MFSRIPNWVGRDFMLLGSLRKVVSLDLLLVVIVRVLG